MLLFLISVGISIFLIAALLIMLLGGEDTIDTRLTEISAPPAPILATIDEAPTGGLAQMAAFVTGVFKPIRSVVSGSDEDMAYRLALAGFRKAEHIEIFTATKMLLPVLAIVAGSFCGDNMLRVILVGGGLGFFVPRFSLKPMASPPPTGLRASLPDAPDRLVLRKQ